MRLSSQALSVGLTLSSKLKTIEIIMSDDQKVLPTAATPAPAKPVVQTIQVGKYQVQVIREKCISAASCVAIAPAVFALDEEGIAKVLDQNGNDDDTKLLAAQSCPTAAIVVIDTQTGQQVWPR
jgi:ferredoxin